MVSVTPNTIFPQGIGAISLISEGRAPSLLGTVDPSFRALSGRLQFTVRRHTFNRDSFQFPWGIAFLRNTRPNPVVIGEKLQLTLDQMVRVRNSEYDASSEHWSHEPNF